MATLKNIRQVVSDGPDISCLECTSIMCHHVEDYLSEGLDAAPLWENFTSIEAAELIIPVPMSYDLPFAVSVLLEKTEVFGVAKMYVIRDVRAGGNDFVGFLNIGDGRLAMSDMVNNYVFARKPANMDCPMTGHTFQAEKRYRELMKTSVGRRYLATCLVMYGECAACHERTTEFDFSDLIPEEDKPRRPWRT